jgi:hypothetical protein
MRTPRHTVGCVRFDKRPGTWNYLFYDRGKRRSERIGTKREYPTKAAAWTAVGPVHTMPQRTTEETVRDESTRYQAERMPTRLCTARVYRLNPDHLYWETRSDGCKRREAEERARTATSALVSALTTQEALLSTA